MFLHGGWFHLIGNMWFLWVFGDNVEDSMGAARFAVFYLLCGFAALAAQAVRTRRARIPMVGASGAIGGVMGAYARLYPRAPVHLLLVFFVFVQRTVVPAFLMLGYWFLLQILGGIPALAAEAGGVAFWAHVGGFVAGVVLVSVFTKPERVEAHRALVARRAANDAATDDRVAAERMRRRRRPPAACRATSRVRSVADLRQQHRLGRRRRGRGLFLLLQRVHGLHDEEDGERDDREVDDRLDEGAVLPQHRGVSPSAAFSATASALKFTPPSSMPSGGISTSLTNEVTILPNAAPITTPTARSTTLPRIANFLNSSSRAMPASFALDPITLPRATARRRPTCTPA